MSKHTVSGHVRELVQRLATPDPERFHERVSEILNAIEEDAVHVTTREQLLPYVVSHIERSQVGTGHRWVALRNVYTVLGLEPDIEPSWKPIRVQLDRYLEDEMVLLDGLPFPTDEQLIDYVLARIGTTWCFRAPVLQRHILDVRYSIEGAASNTTMPLKLPMIETTSTFIERRGVADCSNGVAGACSSIEERPPSKPDVLRIEGRRVVWEMVKRNSGS